MNLLKMEKGITLLLEGMEVDLTDGNFIGTPRRVARMYREMLTPSRRNNWRTFKASSSDMVVLRDHRVVALCPHHLQPVELRCNVGYVPNRRTVGLSKLARAVEARLTTPLLQEDLAEQVAQDMEKNLLPKGVAIILVGRHGCMAFRGVRTSGDIVTSVMRGIFMRDSTARMEFLHLVGEP